MPRPLSVSLTCTCLLALAIVGCATSSLPACPTKPRAAAAAPDSEASPKIEPSSLGFSPALLSRVLQIWVPDLESTGTMLETGIYLGVQSTGLTVGYSQLAGAPGVQFGLSLLRYGDGLRLLGGEGTVLSLVPPTIDLNGRLFFPEEDPADGALLVTTVTTDVVGLRFATCAGTACLHAGLYATVGATGVFVEKLIFRADDELRPGVAFGGAFDLGLIF